MALGKVVGWASAAVDVAANDTKGIAVTIQQFILVDPVDPRPRRPCSVVDWMSAGLRCYGVRTHLWDPVYCRGKTVREHKIQLFVAMSKGPQEQLGS